MPDVASHLPLHGEVRPPYYRRSALYNTDGQIFSDAGVPVVLFMENYDINRQGYHDTHDTMANIDLDYGAALAPSPSRPWPGRRGGSLPAFPGDEGVLSAGSSQASLPDPSPLSICRFNPALAGLAPAERRIGNLKRCLARPFRRFFHFSAARPRETAEKDRAFILWNFF